MVAAQCVKGCNREFDSKRGLLAHQSSCDFFKTSQALAFERRKTRQHTKTHHHHSHLTNTTGNTDGPSTSHAPPDHLHSGGPNPAPDLPAADELAMDVDHPSILSPAPPLLTQSGRPARTHRLPARYMDNLPEPPVPVARQAAAHNPHPVITRVTLYVRDTIRTALNSFGILREYPYRPSYDPDALLSPEDLSDFARERASAAASQTDSDWLHSGSNTKTEAEVNRLVNNVISMPDFKPEDLEGFNAHRENRRLDRSDGKDGAPWSGDEWNEVGVDIRVPTRDRSQGPGKTFTVPGLHCRSIVGVIKAVFSDVASKDFHLAPFKRLWRSPVPGSPEQRVYDELYTSDAFLNAHEALQRKPSEPGCRLEKVVAGLMFWSDGTHLATFGTAKAWPLYMYFGNQSKYVRARPTSGACHHVAFIPSLPDGIQDFIRSFDSTFSGKKSPVLTHCRRELMHEVWNVLLDNDFLHAYEHGIVIRCADGVTRRVYPRIFTYSADYPEKVLLATIRDQGHCPCPRCLVPKPQIDRVGLKRDISRRIEAARQTVVANVTYAVDRARQFLYEKALPVGGVAIENLLKGMSLVPTINTFTAKLGAFDFDPYQMLVVDLLHEFELGVWKATFSHLIRVLYAVSPAGRAVQTLNERYRQIPTFGNDTIRRFSNNASEMKKMAARNFEDLLQCAIPVFEGLIPGHDDLIRRLLFRLAEWHALAKLRMHTDSTLSYLESTTTVLSRELRAFRDAMAAYKTTDLPGEHAARMRRKAGRARKNAAPLLPPKLRKFNLFTYKFHALGDYVRSIRMFGTTDSYSTQIGELAHRFIKRLYARTNKNAATGQIARLSRRHSRLRRAREAALRHAKATRLHPHLVAFSARDRLPPTPMEHHHHISNSRNHPQDVSSFWRNHPDDPAVVGFFPKLQNHILARFLTLPDSDEEPEFSDEDRKTINIINNRIFSTKVFRVNYTTYDVRRGQDLMNPRTHCNIMVRSRETGPNASPYWYARVLGVFHADVLHTGAAARTRTVQRVEFLWVRWYGAVPGYRASMKSARLPKIGFIPDTEPDAFGFLDPSEVIRGCHLIPGFADGRTTELLKCLGSVARPVGEEDDWSTYYVNIWADRDMFMRFIGGGVGHCKLLPLNADVPAPRENSDTHVDSATKDGSGGDDDDDDVDADDLDMDFDNSAPGDGSSSNSDSDSDLEESEKDSDDFSGDEMSEDLGPEDDDSDGGEGDSDDGYASL
ncbi:hypothetical protein PLICRDRAFT_48393 [Plicaturopsis crispa FD-325 SS-3]|nr:hypothetical protein PLICRDRAFT_48393 [Plicaturopsis crispa FD-325 SS-3]